MPRSALQPRLASIRKRQRDQETRFLCELVPTVVTAEPLPGSPWEAPSLDWAILRMVPPQLLSQCLSFRHAPLVRVMLELLERDKRAAEAGVVHCFLTSTASVLLARGSEGRDAEAPDQSLVSTVVSAPAASAAAPGIEIYRWITTNCTNEVLVNPGVFEDASTFRLFQEALESSIACTRRLEVRAATSAETKDAVQELGEAGTLSYDRVKSEPLLASRDAQGKVHSLELWMAPTLGLLSWHLYQRLSLLGASWVGSNTNKRVLPALAPAPGSLLFSVFNLDPGSEPKESRSGSSLWRPQSFSSWWDGLGGVEQAEVLDDVRDAVQAHLEGGGEHRRDLSRRVVELAMRHSRSVQRTTQARARTTPIDDVRTESATPAQRRAMGQQLYCAVQVVTFDQLRDSDIDVDWCDALAVMRRALENAFSSWHERILLREAKASNGARLGPENASGGGKKKSKSKRKRKKRKESAPSRSDSGEDDAPSRAELGDGDTGEGECAVVDALVECALPVTQDDEDTPASGGDHTTGDDGEAAVVPQPARTEGHHSSGGGEEPETAEEAVPLNDALHTTKTPAPRVSSHASMQHAKEDARESEPTVQRKDRSAKHVPAPAGDTHGRTPGSDVALASARNAAATARAPAPLASLPASMMPCTGTRLAAETTAAEHALLEAASDVPDMRSTEPTRPTVAHSMSRSALVNAPPSRSMRTLEQPSTPSERRASHAAPLATPDVSTHHHVPFQPSNGLLQIPGVVGLGHESLNLIAYEAWQATIEQLSEETEDMANMLVGVSGHRRPWQGGALEQLRSLLCAVWPSSLVTVYGSFETGLAIPASDIDVVVSGVPRRLFRGAQHIEILTQHLQAQEWASSVQAIPTAMIPLIKLQTAAVPTAFGDRAIISIDISFTQDSTALQDGGGAVDVPQKLSPTASSSCSSNVDTPATGWSTAVFATPGGGGALRHRGVENTHFVRRLCALHPNLSPLIIVLKQFLQSHGLNDPYKGGLGSYALTIMAAAIVQRHALEPPNMKPALGMLLFSFFKTYGSHTFDTRKLCASLGPEGPLSPLAPPYVLPTPYVPTQREICGPSHLPEP